LSTLRWWAAKVNKQNVVARDNDQYGLARRQYVTNASRVTTLSKEQIESIKDPYTRLSLRLQQAFGLRREEAIKFQPGYAIKIDHLQLKSSWCKGGRARSVPITNHEQRELLKQVEAFAKSGSLIPPELKYVQQLRRYEGQTRRAGMRKLHGLRHGYAQRRFQQLTGFACPAEGGPISRDLTPKQRALNAKARAMISAELGHARENITAVYLGR
ncbi:MAG: integrase domain-containing protein, partial [Woeseiaceae bacterium]